MLKSRIQMLDVTYFLLDKCNYKRMNVINPNLDLWLVNNKNSKYPIIRLTSTPVSEGLRQKNEVMKHVVHISNLVKVDAKLLNVHFNQDSQDEVLSGDYKQVVVNEDYVSGLLLNDFKNFNKALRPIKSDLNSELKRRELKILDLSSKGSRIKEFSIKKVGPTQAIMFINLLVFMGATFLSTKFGDSLAAVLMGGLYKNFIYGANEWWRIITAGFLHVDLFHILMNTLVLFQAGVLVETLYGKKQMIIIYLTSIITSSLLALIMMDGGTVSLGASGGVFGLMGAIIVYLYTSNLVKVPKVRSQIFRTLLANVLISLIPGISFYGHLGGFIGGVLITVSISNSAKLKPMKKHAMISTVIIIVGMVFYAAFEDNNVYNIRPEVDKFTISAVRELGLDDYGQRLEDNMIKYYTKIGESYD
ncbi:MAG TPA: rhomboid family intramembrane serine protease [Erysipelotrichaceae bacterium]|nr:rhomboid family intramembrane serine protease [Erysipelotrichaceae bacterium]